MNPEKVDAIYDSVKRIEGALFVDANPNSPSRITVLEGRVTTLESWRSWLTGAYAVIAAAFGYVVSKK